MWCKSRIENNPGIYCILNKQNDKRYIGKTSSLKRRASTHLNLLRKNKHHCYHLQHAWNMYGEDSFEFYVIQQTETFLEYREYFWWQFFGSNNCYNERIPGDFAPMEGRKHSSKSLNKFKLRMCGEGSPTYGRPRSYEDKVKSARTQGVPEFYIIKDDIKLKFDTFSDAGKFLGCSRRTVARALNVRVLRSGWKIVTE